MKEEVKKKLYNLFWIFIIASILGWFIEGIFSLVTKGLLINHSAVVLGPFNMAYGIGACCLSVLLYKYSKDSNFKIFVVGFIGFSIVEYVMSWGMELVLGFTAWDYSDMFLNVNGRICFLYSCFWGLLAILWVRWIYPSIIKFIDKFNYNTACKVALSLTVFLVFDVLLTISAVNRAREFNEGISPKNKYEELLDKTFNTEYLTNMYNNNWSDK